MSVDVNEYLSKIQLPPGFSISVYAHDVVRARSLAVSESGTVFVGSRGQVNNKPIGNVYAIPDANGDFSADNVVTIAEGLNTPNGVALNNGDLYIAEISRVLRIANVEQNLGKLNTPEVVKDDFPTEAHHGWKFIGFGPDNKLYVPVGAPCNTCNPSERHALIARIDRDGSNYEVFARGIRNTVGFDWHPQTGDLWFTDNGRDMWGDDRPPEELNRATKSGQHFGFPYRYGTDLADDDYKTEMSPSDFVSPMLELPAHTAGLGMRFYQGESFPAQYQGDIFIAYHGSWNRSNPAGYLIVRVDMDAGEVLSHEVFASGWLQEEKYWGRPVDIDMLKDGSLIVSDDHANVVYRIQYTGE
jgi:glucose/arabinose dehydrogenase